MNGYLWLGLIALALFAAFGVLFLLLFRRLSLECIRFLRETERQLGTMAEDVHGTRMAWEQLALRLEAASEPFVQTGEALSAIRAFMQQMRDRYQEGAGSAARHMGWVVEALGRLRPLFRPERDPAPTP